MNRTFATLLLASLLGAAPLAEAQSQSPAFQFPAPPGWARSEEGQVVVFRPPEEPPESVALFVLPPIPRQPDFAGQVEALRAWIASGIGLIEMRNVEERRAGAGGKEQRSHSATYSRAGGDVYLLVLTRVEGTSVGTVVFMATNAEAYDRLRPQAARAFDGMRLPGAGAAPAASSAKPAGFRGPGISGVWMAYIRTSLDVALGRYELVWRWYTFFDDGVVFADLPDAGLWNFDRASSQADPNRAPYWQTYSFSGSNGEMRRAGTRYPWVLKSQKPNELKIDSDIFYRCASVDGLRLEGAWTSYANPDDPDLDRLAPGKRPIIRFGRDGRFVDEGLFAVFMRSYTGGDDRPGSGSYEMRDFTVILRYDDGRVRHEAFTGFMSADPTRKDERIFLHRTPLQKRAGK